MASETEARDREPSMVAAKPGMDADPRMAEFVRRMHLLVVAARTLERTHYEPTTETEHARHVAAAVDAKDALRAFFAAQLAEPDAQWRIVMQAQADTIADLSAQLTERPEPIGNATVVTQASGPMAGNLGEYTDLRIGQIIPRGIYALTLVGEP